jgi:release factor glutamine methyltransferase
VTVDEVLTDAAEKIENSHEVSLWRRYTARSDAEEMLSEVLGKTITGKHLDRDVTPTQLRRFRGFLGRRLKGEPVPLIIGYIEFGGMRIHVDKGVFVPRNSSELMAKEAARRLRQKKKGVAVDLATGAGPVALVVAKRAPRADVIGIDISDRAVTVAAANAKRLKLRNATFLQSDMLQALPRKLRGKINVFTIHPPYVRRREVAWLPTEIKAYEPRHTLNDGSVDGLGLVRQLAEAAPDWLGDGGWILTEVSPDRSLEVRRIMRGAGYLDVRSLHDSVGATRVITARLA